MTDWRWNGARWWKFDFHTHTPASDDYGKGPDQETLRRRPPVEWVLDYMRAEVDCVAVTDHNTGGWIDRLKEEITKLEESAHPDYRELHLFPGMEISVNGGIHLLSIFDPSKTSSDLDALRGCSQLSRISRKKRHRHKGVVRQCRRRHLVRRRNCNSRPCGC